MRTVPVFRSQRTGPGNALHRLHVPVLHSRGLTVMRKRYNLWQRIVMAVRDIRDMATFSASCPGCGSSNVTGGGDKPYGCSNCGSIWQ